MKGSVVYARSIWLAGLMGCFVPWAFNASARNSADTTAQIIERVSSAYNVDRLNNARTIRVEQERRHELPDHDYGPDFHDYTAERLHDVLDFKNQFGSSENLTSIGAASWHGRSILKDGKSQFIIYATGFVQEPVEEDFTVRYGRVIRSYAALLARELVNARGSARYEGEAMWLGRLHDKLTFDMPNSPSLTVFVQKGNGRISKMVRTVGGGTKVSYTFDRYSIQDGVPIALEQSVYANGARVLYHFGRKLVIDDARDENAFEFDAGLVAEPKRVDQSAMTVELITDRIHQVGQGESYSTFFVADSGLTAFGMAAGFAERLDAYRRETGNTQPLNHAIIPAHHRGKMAGAVDAASQGATLLTTVDAAPRVRELVLEAVPDAQIEAIEGSAEMGGLRLISVGTAHASSNLVVYHKASATLAQTGHFQNPYEDAPGFADHTTVSLYEALQPFGLDPRTILSAESRKGDAWDAFTTAVKRFNPAFCHRERAICEAATRL